MVLIHRTLPLTFSRGASLILPDVFIMADCGFFHSGVSVHFVDDHSESQEINLWGGGRDEQTTTTTTKELMNIIRPDLVVSVQNLKPGADKSHQNDQAGRPDEAPYEVVLSAQPAAGSNTKPFFI